MGYACTVHGNIAVEIILKKIATLAASKFQIGVDTLLLRTNLRLISRSPHSPLSKTYSMHVVRFMHVACVLGLTSDACA